MQPVAPRAIKRELPEGDEEEGERQGGEGLVALRRQSDKEIGEVDGREDRQGEEKAVEQLAPGSEIFQRVAAEERPAPQVTADAGREPEAVEAGGDELEERAFRDQTAKLGVVAGEARPFLLEGQRYGIMHPWEASGTAPDA